MKAVDRFAASEIFQLEHSADFDLAILAESLPLAEFGAFMTAERKKWAQIVKAGGIKVNCARLKWFVCFWLEPHRLRLRGQE